MTHEAVDRHDRPSSSTGTLKAEPPTTAELHLEAQILGKNDLLAAQNRAWLAERQVLAVNLMSSPGAGKTTLLARTIEDFGRSSDRLAKLGRSVTDLPALRFSAIEGDQATARDAERIRATGCPVVQINTGSGCHLDAAMVQRGFAALAADPAAIAPGTIIAIENVGNLVCPALFDLGEAAKVVMLSVTEGEDKPLKYPQMFRAAELVLLTKIDLQPYVPFDLDRCLAAIARVNPRAQTLVLSSLTGEGLDAWYDWLIDRWQASLRPTSQPAAIAPTVPA